MLKRLAMLADPSRLLGSGNPIPARRMPFGNKNTHRLQRAVGSLLHLDGHKKKQADLLLKQSFNSEQSGLIPEIFN